MDLGQGWRTGRLDLEPLLAGHPAGLSPTGAVHNGEVCWITSKTESPERPENRHS
jgi:hypothetical protein